MKRIFNFITLNSNRMIWFFCISALLCFVLRDWVFFETKIEHVFLILALICLVYPVVVIIFMLYTGIKNIFRK